MKALVLGLGEFRPAYDAIARAGETGALQVLLSRDSR
jgi:hypothetical protein